jgi:hypothetical protein
MRRQRLSLLAALIALLTAVGLGATGCGFAAEDAQSTGSPPYESSPPSSGGSSGGSTGGSSTGDSTGGSTSGGSSDGGSSDGGSTSGDDGSSSDGGEGSTPGDKEPTPGQLTAGEWRDLNHWQFWTDLFASEDHDWQGWADKWGIEPKERYAVQVTSGKQPVTDARVELVDAQGQAIWSARTDNRGRAELFNGFAGQGSSGKLSIEATAGGADAVKHDVSQTTDGRIELSFDQVAPPSKNLDVMFTIDTTGSMGDELSYLQSELEDVISRTQQRVNQQLSIRLSVNAYRDETDSYVVESEPFRQNIARQADELSSHVAGGGGDYPEAVGQALDDAINGHEWRSQAQARILFLILDAPPHDDSAVKAQIQSAAKKAAKQGIRIVPIAASGVDKSTEYLMRALGIGTGGSYVFLTDHSGIGNSHIEPTIGQYEVHYLNNLIVDIITRYTMEIAEVTSAE